MFGRRDRFESDQADALRILVEAPAYHATTIAITSGKGGVGKTNVAVNLAVALAGRGLKVCLLDLDLGLANADVLMDLHGPRNLSHVVSGGSELDEILLEGPSGVRLVPGASGLERLADLCEFERCRLLEEFHTLETQHDFLIVDLGAGVSRNVITFARAADRVMVVTTPEPTALTDAYATIKMLSRQDRACDIEVLVNLVESRKEARQTYERLAGVAGRFLGLPVTLAGYILADAAVTRAVRSRRPFVLQTPGSNATACIRALAHKYVKQVGVPAMKEGFFSRVAQIFM